MRSLRMAPLRRGILCLAALTARVLGICPSAVAPTPLLVAAIADPACAVGVHVEVRLHCPHGVGRHNRPTASRGHIPVEPIFQPEPSHRHRLAAVSSAWPSWGPVSIAAIATDAYPTMVTFEAASLFRTTQVVVGACREYVKRKAAAVAVTVARYEIDPRGELVGPDPSGAAPAQVSEEGLVAAELAQRNDPVISKRQRWVRSNAYVILNEHGTRPSVQIHVQVRRVASAENWHAASGACGKGYGREPTEVPPSPACLLGDLPGAAGT